MAPQPSRHPVGFAAQLIPDTGINRLRFEAAQRLLDAGAEIVDETGRESIGGARLILAVQAARATHTFESVLALCRIGRGVQAAMLNRSLFEDALDVHWVAAQPNDAPVRADDHDRAIALAERLFEERFGRPVVPLTDAERNELDELKRRYRDFRASWTGASEPDRIELVKRRWGPEAAQDLDYVYEVIQRQNNVMTHASPTAYGLAMGQDRRQINRIGPDARWRDSLGHGVLGYYMVCRVVAEEFGIDKQPAMDAYWQASCFLKPMTDSDVAALDGSNSCPCGSGRTVAECHGS